MIPLVQVIFHFFLYSPPFFSLHLVHLHTYFCLSFFLFYLTCIQMFKRSRRFLSVKHKLRTYYSGCWRGCGGINGNTRRTRVQSPQSRTLGFTLPFTPRLTKKLAADFIVDKESQREHGLLILDAAKLLVKNSRLLFCLLENMSVGKADISTMSIPSRSESRVCLVWRFLRIYVFTRGIIATGRNAISYNTYVKRFPWYRVTGIQI